jgi:hypothetical protein
VTVARPPPALEPSIDRELDRSCEWLRATLRDHLVGLRAASEGGRAELDVLLAPIEREVMAPAPIPATVADLARRLALRDDERAIVAVLLACAFEPGLGRALGLLFDPLARPVVTREAVTAVLGLPRGFRLTAEDGVARWRVIVSADDGLALDPTIEARLLGRKVRDPSLVERLAIIPAHAPLPGWPVDVIADQVRRAIAAGARGVRLWLRGLDGSGRRTLFASVARALGLVGAVAAIEPGDAAVVRAALRLARLEDLALAWTERVSLPADVPGPALEGWLHAEPPPPRAGIADHTVSMPALDRVERRAAWQAIVPAFAGWTSSEQSALIDRWSARPGQLVAAALAGVATAADAAAQLHIEATERLERHCEILKTPFDWDDLILPPSLLAALRELAAEARTLPALWDEPAVGRLFPHGRAITALFCGPPGTGKTMAAQIVAREIGLPLFRVDLSRIVSKYIGETSQNLARVIGAAHHTEAVVFFDEADALFGKRTDIHDAHDRHANTETDYLLQALDAWPGVALLATNKRANIDHAFARRMRLVLEFPRADAAERAQLWVQLGAAILGADADVLAPVLARAVAIELTGAQIKGALLTARAVALAARARVTAAHLARGIERELDKDGRSLATRERLLLVDGP